MASGGPARPTEGSALRDPLPRLLVVDDEAIFRDEFVSLLTREGYPVRSAGSVDEALGQLEKEPFDVLLCDNKMPKRSGASLVAEARERWPSMQVVNITGQPSESAARSMLEHGGFYYIAKPFRFGQIRNVLNDIRAEEELRRRMAPPQTVASLARSLIGEGWNLLGMAPTRLPEVTGLRSIAWDPSNLASAIPALDEDLREGGRQGLVVLLSDDLVKLHGRTAVVALARDLRARMHGIGPTALGITQTSFSLMDVFVLREMISLASVTFGGFGAAGPRRRALVRALRTGPKTLEELGIPADGDDFLYGMYCLQNLQEHGILRSDVGGYRLTSHGSKVAQALAELEERPGASRDGSRLFTVVP